MILWRESIAPVSLTSLFPFILVFLLVDAAALYDRALIKDVYFGLNSDLW